MVYDHRWSFNWTIVGLIAMIRSENWNSFLLTDIPFDLTIKWNWKLFSNDIDFDLRIAQSKFVSSLYIYRGWIFLRKNDFTRATMLCIFFEVLSSFFAKYDLDEFKLIINVATNWFFSYKVNTCERFMRVMLTIEH